MIQLDKPLILASESLQRQKLLQLLRIEYVIASPLGEEVYQDDLSFSKQIEAIAKAKAQSLSATYSEGIIIGADTVIVIDHEILGKPKDADDAFKMLKRLSGRTHEVITGVCITSSLNTIVFSVITKVEFYPMSDDEISNYVSTGEPMGKSGSYSIQGGASLFVKSITGDVNSVIGLPITQVYRVLRDNPF